LLKQNIIAIGDSDGRSVPLAFTFARARCRVAPAVAGMSQNSVDTFLRIQVQERTTVATPYSMSTTAPLSPSSSNEKEIRFTIRLL
jgi:hypothetical protein